jgi:hypothetical protein
MERERERHWFRLAREGKEGVLKEIEGHRGRGRENDTKGDGD